MADVQEKVAYGISRAFGPESTMAVVMWILLSFFTDLVWQDSILLIIGTFITNIALPICVFVVFYLSGRLSDIEATDRRQRPPILVIIQLSYTIGIIFIYYFGSPQYISFAIWVYLVLFMAMLISFFWKISLHMVGNTIVALLLIELFMAPIWLVGLMLGMVAWSRLVLKKHTPLQLFGGLVVPIVFQFIIR